MSEEITVVGDMEPTKAEINSDTLLLVRGSKGKTEDKDYIKKLAKAIIQVHQKHGLVSLRCVGAAALNNAEKAFIIARGEAEKEGEELVSRSQFVTVDFDGSEKTGILKEVFKR